MRGVLLIAGILYLGFFWTMVALWLVGGHGG